MLTATAEFFHSLLGRLCVEKCYFVELIIDVKSLIF